MDALLRISHGSLAPFGATATVSVTVTIRVRIEIGDGVGETALIVSATFVSVSGSKQLLRRSSGIERPARRKRHWNSVYVDLLHTPNHLKIEQYIMLPLFSSLSPRRLNIL